MAHSRLSGVNALLLATLVWLPRVDAAAEVAHDMGLDDELRATIQLEFEVEAVTGDDWSLTLYTATRTWVRENRRNETFARISPQHINYPVGAALRFHRGDGWGWGLMAHHQSNHDVDVSDETLNRETVSYEIYGGEFFGPMGRIYGGLYYDRGTRLDGTQQVWPFDYYLTGINFEGEWPRASPWSMAGHLSLVGHRNGKHDPPHLNIDGHLDLGANWYGSGGRFRAFVRVARVEDYQYLGDDVRHLALLGVRFSSL